MEVEEIVVCFKTQLFNERDVFGFMHKFCSFCNHQREKVAYVEFSLSISICAIYIGTEIVYIKPKGCYFDPGEEVFVCVQHKNAAEW